MPINIIESVIQTNRSRELVSQIIPILISWAKLRLTNKTYGDLLSALGYTRFSGIGRQLGNVETVLRELRESTGAVDIPTLNALVKKPKLDRPADGFDFVYPNYKKLSVPEKKIFIAGMNEKACAYTKWDWVLKELGLKEAIPLSEYQLNTIKNVQFNYGGGEGVEHKNLREYIFEHPESINYNNIVFKETEYILPSGDRLDVYFEFEDRKHVAIEVKPSTSPESDIIRGIFQCVKYKAVMDALKRIECQNYRIEVILLAAKKLSFQERTLAEDLGISYIENFKM
ncbi:hypothetical protein [Prevotella jejuni]